MRNLSQTLERCYEDSLRLLRSLNSNIPPIENTIYMTVPLTSDYIEVPVFLMNALPYYPKYDAIVTPLFARGLYSPYKSVPNNIRNALGCNYSQYHLQRVSLEGDQDIYYGTYGAIFNKDFVPIMMLTWEIEKVPSQTTLYKYKVAKPVLRVTPEVFRKSNAVEKYIVNRIIPEVLSLSVDYPYVNNSFFYNHTYDEVAPRIKVIIDDCPYKLRHTEAPSFSTTNRELLKLALDNLDELTQ